MPTPAWRVSLSDAPEAGQKSGSQGDAGTLAIVLHSCFELFIQKWWAVKARKMTPEEEAKIRGLAQADIPIAERRSLYNALHRKVRSGTLKPGLVEKYNAAASRKERFSLLKEFMIDEDMSGTYITFIPSSWTI